MKLREVKEILKCEVLWGDELLDEIEVIAGCGSDLMSDVLAFIKPDALLLTGLATVQSIQTAHIAEVKGVVYVRGKMPPEEVIETAKEKGIPILRTTLRMYEACGRLYKAGLPGVGEIEEDATKVSISGSG